MFLINLWSQIRGGYCTLARYRAPTEPIPNFSVVEVGLKKLVVPL